MVIEMEEEVLKIIKKEYGDLKHFIDKIGLPYSTVHTIFKRGFNNSNVENVVIICDKLGISTHELIKNHKIKYKDNLDVINFDSLEIKKIPVFGTIKAGIPLESQNDITEYVEIPKNWTNGGKEYFGIKISGDSMFPKYAENDIVIFEKVYDLNSCKNKDCAIMINHSESTFKKVLFNESGIVLQPYNTAYDLMMFSNKQIKELPVRIIGKAIEKRTKI